MLLKDREQTLTEPPAWLHHAGRKRTDQSIPTGYLEEKKGRKTAPNLNICTDLVIISSAASCG